MRKLLLPLAASVLLLSSAAFAQTSDTKAPATTGPAAQSGDNMSKGDMSKDTMSKTRRRRKRNRRRLTTRCEFDTHVVGLTKAVTRLVAAF